MLKQRQWRNGKSVMVWGYLRLMVSSPPQSMKIQGMDLACVFGNEDQKERETIWMAIGATVFHRLPTWHMNNSIIYSAINSIHLIGIHPMDIWHEHMCNQCRSTIQTSNLCSASMYIWCIPGAYHLRLEPGCSIIGHPGPTTRSLTCICMRTDISWRWTDKDIIPLFAMDGNQSSTMMDISSTIDQPHTQYFAQFYCGFSYLIEVCVCSQHAC